MFRSTHTCAQSRLGQSHRGQSKVDTGSMTVRPSAFATVLCLVFLVSLCTKTVPAQSITSPETAPSGQANASQSADLKQINEAVKTFYDAISTGPGSKLNRERLHELFVPGGRIASAVPPKGTSPARIRIMTLDEYADGSDRFTTKYGFFDHVLHNRVDKFGLMAHVYSTYESRNDPSDAMPMARGIKSIDLLHTDGKWLLVQVLWDSERPDNPIPLEYLP